MKFEPWMTVVGDQSFRGECPPEGAEQTTVFNAMRRALPLVSALAFHPKNEGKRTHAQAAVDKAKGMKKGVCDIVVPCARPVLIELKRKDHTKSTWQAGQVDYMLAAHKAGARAFVALGADAAFSILEDLEAELQDR